MATKAKESSVVGKEKKAPSSNSPITTTKKTTGPSTTTGPTDKATISNLTTDKQVPNYLKPTLSSRLVESHSFKPTKNDASNKPTLNRRRSFDKPPSPSRLPKQTHPSPPSSRQHKALVSPGPRERSLSMPIKSTNSSKPSPKRLSKTPKEGKAQQPSLFAKSDKKTRSPSPSTSTTPKKVPKDASSDSTNDTKSTDAETITEVTNVENEPEVKEAINEKDDVEEVEKVEKQEEEVENKIESEISPHVEYEHEYENKNDHDHEVEESDQSHVQADHDKNLIPTMPKVEAAKEEKHDEDANRNQEECNNINGTIPEINHSTIEEEVEVKEKEEEKEEEEEVGQIIEEDHKSENNNEEEAVVEEKKEGVEGGISEEVNVKKEGQDDEEEEKVEREAKEEVKAEESTQPKQQVQHERKESQVSNDVIEETASKLLESRKNKVRALAGAFQTVIDHQTK